MNVNADFLIDFPLKARKQLFFDLITAWNAIKCFHLVNFIFISKNPKGRVPRALPVGE